MEVNRLELIDFRNYLSQAAEFGSELNVIIGRNGQGKTNLLEAVHSLSVLGSHRSSANSPLVRHGADKAYLRAQARSSGRGVRLDAEIPRSGGMRLLVNKVALERASDSELVLASVLFSPEDLMLTKGGPEERRRFLDHAAARMRPLAATQRLEFERVLKQRNGVLKASLSNPRALRQLDVWTEQLVSTGAVVVVNRLEVLKRIASSAEIRHQQVSDSTDMPSFRYVASWADAEAELSSETVARLLSEQVGRSQVKELERGVTLVGPHRDDLEITLAGVDARTFASQGEQRSLALSLRLAERDLIADIRGEDPVLLLDDVFSELDEHRRARLAELVVTSGQTIATATSVDGLPLKGGRTITVDQGRLDQL